MTPILYLYALVDEELSGPLGEGIGGEPLRLVRCGGIAAVAGELGDRPRPSRETLQAQDVAVQRLSARFSALLPARFGAVFADEPAVVREVARRDSDLAAALVLVRGCVQMTLRVFGEPWAAPEIGQEPGEGAGRRYLEARRLASQWARSLPEIEPLREILRPLVRAERIERHATGRLLGTAYHLVPRPQAEAYLAALADAGERLGRHRVAASGPWAPYAFAPEAVR